MTLQAGELSSKTSARPENSNKSDNGSRSIEQYGATNLKEFLSNKDFHLKKQSTPNKLYAGMTPKQAAAMLNEWAGIKLASNKLYLIEIIDLSPDGDSPREFQLFTTSISYSPVTIPSEKQSIGSGVMDGVKGTEAIDLSLTTYDDKRGTLKRWFDKKAGQVAGVDGSVGLPVDYLVQIRILHSFFSNELNDEGYEVKFLMRPVSIEHTLDRDEGGQQKLPMVFTQFDTFM